MRRHGCPLGRTSGAGAVARPPSSSSFPYFSDVPVQTCALPSRLRPPVALFSLARVSRSHADLGGGPNPVSLYYTYSKTEEATNTSSAMKHPSRELATATVAAAGALSWAESWVASN